MQIQIKITRKVDCQAQVSDLVQFQGAPPLKDMAYGEKK